ncbi:MAG: hypothetical protein GX194_07380 [Clostridium sp.]|nr:hypothetical protein [Clostridium sp.]
MSLELFGIEDLIMSINKNKMYIEDFYTDVHSNKYIYIFSLNSNRYISCRFEIARIQNIKPIIEKE